DLQLLRPEALPQDRLIRRLFARRRELDGLIAGPCDLGDRQLQPVLRKGGGRTGDVHGGSSGRKGFPRAGAKLYGWRRQYQRRIAPFGPAEGMGVWEYGVWEYGGPDVPPPYSHTPIP